MTLDQSPPNKFKTQRAKSGLDPVLPSFYSYQSLPLELEKSPLFHIEGSGPTVLKVQGQGGPFYRVKPSEQPPPTSFVSRDEFKAIIAPEGIAKAGTYIVTLCAKEKRFPTSMGPIAWWVLSHSELRFRGREIRLGQIKKNHRSVDADSGGNADVKYFWNGGL